MTQHLALFDLDNTLLAGDSDYNWSLFLISEGLLDAKTHHDRNEQFYADYKAGQLNIVEFLKSYYLDSKLLNDFALKNLL